MGDDSKNQSDESSIDPEDIEKYREVLMKVWEDGILTVEEQQLLSLLKEKMNITDEIHRDLEYLVLGRDRATILAIGELDRTGNSLEDEYRRRFPPRFRARDGHLVRNEMELNVDNYLYENGFVHSYQSEPLGDGKWVADFFLPDQGLYIEVWDTAENDLFAERKREKLNAYLGDKNATPINLSGPEYMDAVKRILGSLRE